MKASRELLRRIRALQPSFRPPVVCRAIAAFRRGEEPPDADLTDDEIHYAERVVEFIRQARLSDVGEGEELEELA